MSRSSVHLFVVALLGTLIYSNTFTAPFVFDDFLYIVDNEAIRNLGNFLDLSGSRYVALLSFALNYSVSGLSTPTGFHLTNTAIHIFNAALVYWLVVLIFRTPAMERAGLGASFTGNIAFFSALLFVCHPLETQAVSYITQRFASLAALFFLLSLVFFMKWRLAGIGGRRAYLYAFSLASAVLAMKTKETAFTLPLIIVLVEFVFFDHTPRWRERLRYLAPFLLTLFIVPLTILLPGEGAGSADADLRVFQLRDMAALSTHDYFITQLRVIVTYIRLIFIPINQSADYGLPLFTSFFDIEVLLSFLFLLLVFVFTLVIFVRSRRSGSALGLLASFGIFWFFITLSIESSVVPIKDVMFEHRVYLPSVGAFFAVTSGVFYLLRRFGPFGDFITVAVLLVVFILPLSVGTYKRNLVWADPMALWEDVARKRPRNPRGWCSLGRVFYDRGLLDRAIENYRTCIALDPANAKAHYNTGLALFDMGRPLEAAAEYKLAIGLKPDYADAHNNLGTAYASIGRVAEAVKHFREALALDAALADARFNLALALKDLGLVEEAAAEFRVYLRLVPEDEEARDILRRLTGNGRTP